MWLAWGVREANNNTPTHINKEQEQQGQEKTPQSKEEPWADPLLKGQTQLPGVMQGSF